MPDLNPRDRWTAADFSPAELREAIGRLQDQEEARVTGLREVRRSTDQPALARHDAAAAEALLASALAQAAVANERLREVKAERDAMAAEASNGVRELAEALVAQGAHLREAHALVERQAAALKRAEAGADANEVAAGELAAGELAARRWLDSLVEYGLPSTTYERADGQFRAAVTRLLRFTAEHANRLLGDFHAIPDAAWERRDTTWPEGPRPYSEVDLADLRAMFDHNADEADDDEATGMDAEREDDQW